MTLYVVLRQADTPAVWVEIDSRYEAHSAQQAIRKAVEDIPADLVHGRYAAVPVRSWTVEPVGLVQSAPRIVVGPDAATQLTLVPEPEPEPEEALT